MAVEKKKLKKKSSQNRKGVNTKKGAVKKFKPKVIPRYLPGSVPAPVLLADLKTFNEHRYNIFSAVPKVDTSPPKMNPYNYLDLTKLADNARRLQRIDSENKNLLRKINLINRHGGKVDTFNPKAYDRGASKWYEHETESLRIVQDNKVIYDRIVNAQSLTTKASHDKFWKEMLTKMKFMCRYPVIIFEKHDYDKDLRMQPSISALDPNNTDTYINRPICYMTFRIDNGMKLGTIYIVLYSDYVPVTCENFLSLCKIEENELTYKNSILYNVVKCKYIELGDITLGNGKGGKTIYGDKFAEENFLLKHAKAGVLSTVPVGNHENSSMFTITLQEMPKFNDKRVVFGKIVKGYETMLKINDLAKKVGKPNPPIRIIDCGECNKKTVRRIPELAEAAGLKTKNLQKKVQ